MTISTYAELQTAVQNWMDRSDFSSRVPEFIALAEAFFNRKLRCREMVATSSFTTTAGTATLPTDFLQAINVYWNGSTPKSLEEYPDQVFEDRYGALTAGPPEAYLIRGLSIYVAPVDNTTQLKLIYYQKIPALASSSTNWLLTAHPDLYLFAALTEAELFTLDSQAASIWGPRRDAVLEDVWRSGQFYRGAAPGIRISGPTP